MLVGPTSTIISRCGYTGNQNSVSELGRQCKEYSSSLAFDSGNARSSYFSLIRHKTEHVGTIKNRRTRPSRPDDQVTDLQSDRKTDLKTGLKPDLKADFKADLRADLWT
ncbi:uncharacterized protein PHALS_03384 [Plasmopara halstedii]|uniref:Uncharacterized protein n=1 Tax=Plasmopara halstedii TaxID=4781 RepID=A0A0P1AYV9_PLAHL|nr:uncharacterized protein PHALS_03384 [Plasmopara halstedii]CEG46703.1 hypothetical protein PHALS_03384 [Plasmopara halstedii]|eukprot:XP_024583072.1 hypothetical protein PHALS_03384 [Plasmopara halstedii]